MKPELTPKLKERFFAQYYGQKVIRSRECGLPRDVNGVTLQMMEFNSAMYLLLRPIASITDEEAIELTKFIFPENEERHTCSEGVALMWDTLNSTRNSGSWLKICDYWRHKGFVIPYLGHSVEDLISAGWVKLIDKPE
jgi:hypothetical protein